MDSKNKANYGTMPFKPTLDIQPFTAHVDEAKLQHFRQLLELSPIAPPAWENTHAGFQYGVTREWMVAAKKTWLDDFNWRKHEDDINSFPNFTTSVVDANKNTIDLHFAALFSRRKDATPLVLLHGWPGSFCEFLELLDLLRAKYTPDTLPYHVIVPSLPGYAYSSNLPVTVDYSVDLTASAIHALMVGLGFDDTGYYAQGGDLGSFVSQTLARSYDACKGIHVNQMLPPFELMGQTGLTDMEQQAVQKMQDMQATEWGFFMEQATKPATIGFALSASPLSLLSWLGEKFLAWTDRDLPLDKVLQDVTLYWMTETIPRCFYHNRAFIKDLAKPLPFLEKPTGYSLFAKEIVPVPESNAAKKCNIVFFNAHESGGHFAAMEKPSELLADVEAYMAVVRKTDGRP